MDFRTYSSEMANASQNSNQSVEQFGQYIARVLANQIAAYNKEMDKKKRPKKYVDEDIKRFDETAASTFVEGLSGKPFQLKERLLYHKFEHLSAAINEAKRVGKQLENERKKYFTRKTEEYMSKKKDDKPSFKKTDKKAYRPTENQKGFQGQIQKTNEKQGEKKKPFICFKCQKPGHKAADCRSNPPAEKPESKKTEDVAKVQSINVNGENSKNSNAPIGEKSIKMKMISAVPN
jgi:hypothetical protein